MMNSNKAAIVLAASTVGIGSFANAAATGWNQSATGPFEYTDTANWVGGTINGIWGADLDVPASQTITFSQSTALTTGLDFAYTGSGNLTFRAEGGAQTLTLGGDISHQTGSGTRTINFGSTTGSQNLNVDLGGATRTFTVGSGRTLGFVNVISNGGVIVNGGTVNYSGANTYAGTTTVNTGNLSLNGSTGSAANSDFRVNAAGTTTLTFNGSSGSGTTRAKSVTLSGLGASGAGTATLSVSGNSSANTIEAITNALTLDPGYSRVSISPNGSRNTQLSAASLVRSVGTTAYFRGTSLGVNTIASQTANSANIVFSTAPTLVGGAGSAGTPTVSLLPGSYGSIVSNTDTGQGLVTYDSTYGVRLLDASTEYTTAITNGQSALENVLYARASGGASQNTNLTAATTTINSLSFRITGTGTNSGVTISGDVGTSLKLNSGTVFASQAVTTANATDAMTISVPKLDLNGREGSIIAFTNGINQGNTPAPLFISSEITNDGGNGVTFAGTGQTILNGSVASSYTGVTRLNSGILRLDRIGVDSIPGDLVMNGGTLLKRSNTIPDTASVTINGGGFILDSTTSSGNNGHTETIANLTMNGGGIGSSSGANNSLIVTGNAALNASQISLQTGGDFVVNGSTSLNGGRLVGSVSSSTSVRNGQLTLNTVSITNTALTPYTPITLNAHATNQGSLLTLNGNLTFTGNSTNANSVLIDSSNLALANQGVVALVGTRTFDIGNGAADVDVQIIPAIVDGSTTGGLSKTGAGTLLLSGNSTYTGPTNVSAGKLVVDGSLTSAVTVTGGTLGGSGSVGALAVNSGGTLAPGNSPGVLDSGDLQLDAGSVLSAELNGTSVGTQYDQVNVTGGVSIAGDLSAALGYAPTLGDNLFIINNDGADAVSGGFANLGVGNTVDLVYSSSTYRFVVSYVGDFGTNSATGGNDVVLTNVLVPEPASLAVVALAAMGLTRRRRVA